nr:DoxX family protein [Acidimicrobiia bacterium]
METTLFGGETWLAVLRIGVGLWWLESWRHKDKTAWFRRGSGIS